MHILDIGDDSDHHFLAMAVFVGRHAHAAPDILAVRGAHAHLVDRRPPFKHCLKRLRHFLPVILMDKILRRLLQILLRRKQGERPHIRENLVPGHAENRLGIFKIRI